MIETVVGEVCEIHILNGISTPRDRETTHSVNNGNSDQTLPVVSHKGNNVEIRKERNMWR